MPVAQTPSAHRNLEEVTPAQEVEQVREKVTALVADAIIYTDAGTFVDLDLFTQMLMQRAIPYRDLNRPVLFGELQVVREEHSAQKTKAENVKDLAVANECYARSTALERREKQILDQLWPIS